MKLKLKSVNDKIMYDYLLDLFGYETVNNIIHYLTCSKGTLECNLDDLNSMLAQYEECIVCTENSRFDVLQFRHIPILLKEGRQIQIKSGEKNNDVYILFRYSSDI